MTPADDVTSSTPAVSEPVSEPDGGGRPTRRSELADPGVVAGRRVALVLATSTGGVGRHVHSLAGHLHAAGADVRVFGPAATEDLFGFTRLGVAFGPIDIAAGLRPTRDAAAVLALRHRTTGFDLIHAHGLRAGLVAVLGSAGRTAPVVVTWHNLAPGALPVPATAAATSTSPRPAGAGITGSGRPGGSGWSGPARHVLTGRLERLVARRAEVTLGVSADLVARAWALGGRDVRLAPVGAPPLPPPSRSRDDVRAELGAGDRPLVLAIGRLHPQKGYDILVAAAARWRDRDPVPLVVVSGSGPLRDELAAAITRTGAPVRLLGRRDDIADLLAAADVAVLPSKWEARSLVAQEALRAGLPLVTTRVGGLPGLVGDAAVLIPPDDVPALDAAVRRLLASPRDRAALAARARAQAATWPTEADTAGQVAAVYAELLGPSAG